MRVELKVFNGLPIAKLQEGIAGEEIAMRIDLNPSIGQTPDSGEPTKPGLRPSSGPAGSELAADVAQPAADYVPAQVITKAVNQLPEIRQEKVAALAQLISSGNYAVTSEQTAAALLSHMAGSAAA
jgi:hypothetical protein